MRQLIDQYEIMLVDQRGDDAGVGEVTGTEHTGCLRPLEASEAGLQFRKQGMIAGDQPRGAAADAVAIDRLAGGALDRGVVGQIEVVVAAKRDEVATVAPHMDAVRTIAFAEPAPKARRGRARRAFAKQSHRVTA